MEEIENKPDEKTEEAIEKPEESPAKDADEGVQPKTTPFIDEANKAAEKLAEENKKKDENLKREEQLQDRKEALNALGGGSPAGTKPPKPAKLTDTEYAEALERGEVNPLKEDGII